MVVIYADIGPTVAALAEMKERYRASVAENFAEAGQQVVDLFREDWLSGRRGDGRGLNIQSGNLFQSVRSVTTVRPNSVTSEVFNRGADYWFYHEHPENGRHQFLHLEQAFTDDGGKLYEDAIELALEAIQ